MQLNAFYLQLNPLPHQLSSEGSKFFDEVLPHLVSLLEKQPDSKLSLVISGFGLEKLQARKRASWLEKLARLSGIQIEFLSSPFYDLAPRLLTEHRFIQQLDYQLDFWKSFNISPSNSLGINSQYQFNPELITALEKRGIRAIVADSALVKNRVALARLSDSLLLAPTTILNLSNEHLFKDRNFQFQLSAKVPLRSIALCPNDYTSASAQLVTSYLDTILCAEDQGFLLPSEFAYLESAQEEVVFNKLELPLNLSYSNVELAWKRCDEVPAIIEDRAEKAKKENRLGERHGSLEKYQSALKFIHQGSSRELDFFEDPKAHRSSKELILYGIVDLESYLKPDIDPTFGWIEKQSTENATLLNTQLADYILDNKGGLSSLDYKPRKASLLSSLLPSSFNLSFSEDTNSDSENNTKSALTRKTKDLCSIRFEETRLAKSGSFNSYREFTFRAGVGAHLPNATTGFSFEYWLEGDIPASLIATLSFSFCLPSPNLESGLIKPLLCVGGVSEKRYYLEKQKHVDLSELTGGAYGVRIIDSVEDLTMDLRSAKQIEEIVISPIFSNNKENPVYLGSTVSLSLRAERINGDDKSNTLFFSIL